MEVEQKRTCSKRTPRSAEFAISIVKIRSKPAAWANSILEVVKPAQFPSKTPEMLSKPTGSRRVGRDHICHAPHCCVDFGQAWPGIDHCRASSADVCDPVLAISTGGQIPPGNRMNFADIRTLEMGTQ